MNENIAVIPENNSRRVPAYLQKNHESAQKQTPNNKTLYLTPKQLAFADHYLKTGNARQSALAAGYAKTVAGYVGCKNLQHPIISEYIRRKQVNLSKKTELTLERVTKETARLAFVDPGKIVDDHGEPLPLHKIPVDVRRAIQQVDCTERFIDGAPVKQWRYKFYDKTKSLEHGYRHLGAFKDRLEISVDSAIDSVLAAITRVCDAEQVERIRAEIERELRGEIIEAEYSPVEETAPAAETDASEPTP